MDTTTAARAETAIKAVAHFIPQTWIRDWAVDVDPEGPTTWDCSSKFSTLPEDYRAQLLDEIDEFGEALDDSDLLKDDPSAPEWVRNWSGPFSIYVRTISGLAARFSPQAWIDDIAVESDPEGPTTWRVSPEAVAALPGDYCAELLTEVHGSGEALDRRDLLKDDPSAPEWVRRWRGPFHLYVTFVES